MEGQILGLTIMLFGGIGLNAVLLYQILAEMRTIREQGEKL